MNGRCPANILNAVGILIHVHECPRLKLDGKIGVALKSIRDDGVYGIEVKVHLRTIVPHDNDVLLGAALVIQMDCGDAIGADREL